MDCIRNNQQGTLETEELAKEYLFGEDVSLPNTFHFHEQYEGRDGFNAHAQSPHFAVWEKFAATDPFTKSPEVFFYAERRAPGEGNAECKGRYCLNVRMGIKPERRDEFLSCIANNQRGTLESEPLALEYVFGEDENVPNVFHFHEQYVDRKGFDAHTKTKHFAAWEAFVETDPFSQLPEVSFFQEVA